MRERVAVLVVFDVSDARRRARLGRFLQERGLRVQMSAFECRVRAGDLEAFQHALAELIDPQRDRLHVVRLCRACEGDVFRAGKPLASWPEGDEFIT